MNENKVIYQNKIVCIFFIEQLTGINADAEGDVIVRVDPFVEAEESHFFTYFISVAVLSIIMYLVFHNKKKVM